ncbi:hypothetical protein GCM10017783_22440 [Deinococcus piscis]|uniref:Uncharacterized protein n=1 Tax=Deinococcus piscis TaxID=394230 RepID=A0ABQ3K9Y3_9DEIO|nr:hypothetical protein GCM10017783_22440 [Deinococcus piscis]
MTPVPASGFLPRQGIKGGEPHRADVILVGWPQETAYGSYQVAGHQVRCYGEIEGQRVRLVTWPRTDAEGTVKLPLPLGAIRSPKDGEPNGATFWVVGRLMRVDPVTQLLTVRIYPGRAKIPPFNIRIKTTPRILQTVDPSWTAVDVRGGLIGDRLVADQIRPVYAPLSPKQTKGLAEERTKSRKQVARQRRREARLAHELDQTTLKEFYLSLLAAEAERIASEHHNDQREEADSVKVQQIKERRRVPAKKERPERRNDA